MLQDRGASKHEQVLERMLPMPNRNGFSRGGSNGFPRALVFGKNSIPFVSADFMPESRPGSSTVFQIPERSDVQRIAEPNHGGLRCFPT